MEDKNSESNLTLEEVFKRFHDEKYEECFDSLQSYADQKNAEAAAKLGLAFQLGLGVSIDVEKAEHYLSEAANAGIGEAAHNLATLYATVPELDSEKAKHWFEEARKLGFNPGTT